MATRIRYGKKAKEIVEGIQSKEDLLAKLKIQWLAVDSLLERNKTRRTIRFDKAIMDSFNVFAALVAEFDAVLKEEHKQFKEEKKTARIKKMSEKGLNA